jgi:Tol biopolymer transport system component
MIKAKYFIVFVIVLALSSISCAPMPTKTESVSNNGLADWILFRSDRKIGMIQPDGHGERYLYFPERKKLQWYPLQVILPDGRIMFNSQDPPVDPKASFYDKKGLRFSAIHVWLYDFASKNLQEIPVPGVIALMPGGNRFLVADEPDEDKSKTTVYTVNFDGSDKRNFYELGGFCYCFNLSPDGKNIVYHNASEGYKIYALNLETGQKTLLAGEQGYLNFGPEWSPDGQWILFQRCPHGADPMNSRSDLCIVRSDGSELRLLTTGQRQWFGTSYGPGDNHGGGSNFPHWSPDGMWITYTRCSPGAQTAWVYRKDRPDTDHFNCNYAPDQARGGSQICLINPKTGEIREVTPFQEKLWAWRTRWSPDSKQIVYASAKVGQNAELWIINADGSQPRKLTSGFDSKGADFPFWMQLVSQAK